MYFINMKSAVSNKKSMKSLALPPHVYHLAEAGIPERKRSQLPVELTVADAVPNIDRFIVDVCHLIPNQENGFTIFLI